MKQPLFLAALLLAMTLTLVSGILHGRHSNRWGPSQDMQAVGDKVTSIPEDFGAWQLKESETLTDVVMDMLQCTGYVNRTYINEETGAVVHVALLVGPSGPMSLHDPEICYQSTGYQPLAKRQRVPIGKEENVENVLWGTTFKKPDAFADVLQIYYGWSVGGAWDAVDHARFRFAAHPYLYKIQVAGYFPYDTDLDEDDPCREFLREFMPLISTYLVATEDEA